MTSNYLIFVCFSILLHRTLSYVDLHDSETDCLKADSKPIFNFTEIEFGPCNIPVENQPITQQEFIRKYAYASPVIFKKFNNERNKIFQEKCQIDNLYSEYGHKLVTVSTADTYSTYKKYSMKLSDYLNDYVLSTPKNNELQQRLKYGNETWYFFGENNFTDWKDLIELYEKPKYELPKHRSAYSFGIAGGLTGVPFHFHGPGFAETIVGRKRWFLYEPDNRPEFDPDQSTIAWFLNKYKNLKPDKMPLECVLEPLDVIYFPDRFWHATLNIDNGVFISTFLSP